MKHGEYVCWCGSRIGYEDGLNAREMMAEEPEEYEDD